MSEKHWVKRSIVIILSVWMILMMCPFISDSVNGSGHADAAANVSDFANFAYNQKWKSAKTLGVPGKLQRDDTGWCAWFVYYCAKKTGNTDYIAYNTFVDQMAFDVVNKGGKITFVNESAYNK